MLFFQIFQDFQKIKENLANTPKFRKFSKFCAQGANISKIFKISRFRYHTLTKAYYAKFWKKVVILSPRNRMCPAARARFSGFWLSKSGGARKMKIFDFRALFFKERFLGWNFWFFREKFRKFGIFPKIRKFYSIKNRINIKVKFFKKFFIKFFCCAAKILKQKSF